MLEVEVDGDTEVVVNTNVVVTAGNMNVAIIEDTNDIEVTVNRQEYVITGDEIYIPKRFEDAPTWMQELITQVVDTSISAQIQDLNGISQSLESMIDAMEVAKNTYELSVISSNDIDQRINTAVTTLNSAMNEADATVLEVAQTRVTPEEAAVITVDVITAELAKTEAGTLGATVSNLQTAVANEEEARSTSIEILTSSIEGAFDANATAMNYINTYVGLDEVGASTGTGLSGYLEGSTGIVGGADSKVVNNVYVDALGNAKSKFEYGSTVSVNGVTSTAGFGLSNSTGTGIGSEFWINADKFKFTNNNKTGSKAPFTIDASGLTPEITFNGIVEFSNITGTDNLAYTDLSNVTQIDGGKLIADSIGADKIDTYAIAGKIITGGTISGTTISGVQIYGSIIKSSFIDYTSSLALTNWQYYTEATIPSTYKDNFAHHNDGSLVVDTSGYVRLASQLNFLVGNIQKNGILWSGNLYNISINPSISLNLLYDLYSWDSYTTNTLQRSIRQNTQFSSNANLVFEGSVTSNAPIGGAGTDVINVGTYTCRVLDKDIIITLRASNGTSSNSESILVSFNGVTVAYADGSGGIDHGSGSAWLDFTTTIKGVTINFKSTFNGQSGFTFKMLISLTSSTIISNHTINDVFKVIAVNYKLNTLGSSRAGITSCNYAVDFQPVWVQ